MVSIFPAQCISLERDDGMFKIFHDYTFSVCQWYEGRFPVDSYDRYQDALFSRIVSQFVALHCEVSPEKKTSGRVLFRRFREYWNEATHEAKHPALLGQLRVELTELGFASSGGKWPRWYGLSLRKKKEVQAASKKAKMPAKRQTKAHTDIEIYRAIAGKALVPCSAYS
jgi:hypothetical protein